MALMHKCVWETRNKTAVLHDSSEYSIVQAFHGAESWTLIYCNRSILTRRE